MLDITKKVSNSDIASEQLSLDEANGLIEEYKNVVTSSGGTF